MSATLTHYVGLPALWLADNLGLPTTLSYSRYYLADWSIASLLLMAFWVFLVWRRSKQKYYFCLYLFIIALAYVSFQVIIDIPLAWIYAILIIGCGLVFLLLSQTSPHFPQPARRILRRFYLLGLAVSLLMPFSFSWRLQYQQNRAAVRLQSRLIEQETTLDSRLTSLVETLTVLRSDPVLIGFSNQPSRATALSYLQKQQLDNNIGFLILTNNLANVTARSHQPDKAGDNLFEQWKWSQSLFWQGQDLAGIGQDESGRPILIAGCSLSSPDGGEGSFLIIGHYLNFDFWQTLASLPNYALYNQNSPYFYYAPSGQEEGSVYGRFDLAEYLSDQSQSDYESVYYQNQRFILVSRSLAILPYAQPFWQVTLTKIDDPTWLKAVNIFTVLGMGIGLILLLSLSKRFFLDLWKK